jgi:hypothetical protein
MMLRAAIAISLAAIAGCSYKVAKGEYEQGFSASALEGRGYFVRYNGKSMESERSLEKLLRRGVTELCGGAGFSLADVTFEIEEVMHRWKPRYRTVTAVASCGRQP